MALFKIFKGRESEKITNPNEPGYKALVDGYAYYDTSTKLFYIDAEYPVENENGQLTNNVQLARKPINAYHAQGADAAYLARLAERDGQGNEITSYYGHSLDLVDDGTIYLKDANGVSLNSITISTVENATKLTTTSAGDFLKPVYFSGGIPVDSGGHSIPFVAGTGSTAGTWLGSLPGLTAYYDGLMILYKPSVAGASTTKLNINNLGAKTVYRNNTSKLQTEYPVNQPILLIYAANLNSGCWVKGDFNSNTDRYVNTAAFADNTASDTSNPLKMTLTRAGSDTATVTANLPKVSSSSAGVVPKGATVTSQSQDTKFLREDGSWQAPSYTTSLDWSNISNAPSDYNPSSHAHGNISNEGQITATTTIGNHDKLVIVDSDTTANNVIVGTTIEFDGSTTTKALTPKGTWETFNNYTHPTTAGNKHIPSGGSSGQFLGWDSAGTAKWVNNPNTDRYVNSAAFAYDENNSNIKMTLTRAGSDNATVTANIPLVSENTAGLVPILPGDATQKFLRQDGTWADVAVAKSTTLTRNTETTIATIGGNDIKIKLPASDNTDRYVNSANFAYDSTNSNIKMTLTRAGSDTNTVTANIPLVSKTTAGIVPILPNETTTKKFLRQDGTWTEVAAAKSTTLSRNVETTIATINGNDIKIKLPASDNTDRYVNSATFADDTTNNSESPIKMTLTRAGSDNATVTANIPRVSASSAGIVQKGAAVTNQTQTTKFLREDGSWAAPSYTGSITWDNLTGKPSTFPPSSHSHGNISNEGQITLTTTIASGDKLVIVDSDTTANSKLIGSSITFDGSTTTKALTPKGTWETFNNYSHPTSAGNKHIPSGGSSGQFLGWSANGTAAWVANPNTDRYVNTAAFAYDSDNSNVKMTLTRAGSDSATVTGNIPLVSKTTAGLVPILPNETTVKKFLRQDGTWAEVAAAKSTTLSRNTETTIATIGGNDIKIKLPASDNTDRYVNSAAFADDTGNNTNSPLKMTLTRAGSDSASVTANLPKVSSSSAGIAPKGASVTTQSQTTKFLREDGSWQAPSYTTSIAWDNITEKPSEYGPSSHAHGNISNEGQITSTATIANGDKLVIVDSDTTANNKITGTTIQFDGSTTTKALTQKGTWETFNNYTHPTTAGNKHIPTGGSSGQFLGWSASGTAKWVNNPNTDRYVNSATFADDTTNNASSPLKMTLTRAGSDTATVTANLPKITSSGAGIVPKGEAVSSQTQETKFLRSDGSWAAPTYSTTTSLGLSSAMLFKGTAGTNGTVTSSTLPAASSSNLGHTYKIITDGTYGGKAVRAGDVIVSNGTEWIVIPSGDEPSGTVTNIATGGGLTGGPITTTGTISHADTSSQSSITANGRTYITGVTLDDYGHVTKLTTGTETVVNTDTDRYVNSASFSDDTTNNVNSPLKMTLTRAGSDSATVTANLPAVSKTTPGILPKLPNETTTKKFLRQDGQWAEVAAAKETTLTRNSMTTIATINGNDIKIKLPASDNTDHYVNSAAFAYDSTNENVKMTLTRAGYDTATITANIPLVSKNSAGVVKKLPNETTKTKFLCQDGEWTVVAAAKSTTLSRNTETTIATIGGNDIKIKLPASNDRYVNSAAFADDTSNNANSPLKMTLTRAGADSATVTANLPAVSKTTPGILPKLPNETTTKKFLRQDGSWAEVASEKTTTLSYGTTSTIATINGNDIKVTMPASDNTNSYVNSASFDYDSTNSNIKMTLTRAGSDTSTVTANIPLVSTATAGLVPILPGGTTQKFLKQDGTWAEVASAKSTTLARDTETVIATIGGNDIKIKLPASDNTDRYVNSATFADDTTNNTNSPLKMTLTRAGSDTSTVTANLPKVSSSSAGIAPKGEAVSSQSQSTKFLRSDGTWAAPSYSSIPNLSGGASAANDAKVIGGITVSGHAITAAQKTISGSNGITITGGTSTITVKHSNSAVTAKTSFVDTATTAHANGGKIKVTDIKYDAYGHITGSQDREITLSQTTYTLAGLMGSSAKGSTTLPVYWTGSAFSTIDSLTLTKSSNPKVSLKNTTMDLSRAATPSATQYNSIYMYDKNSYLGAYLQQYQNTTGDSYFYISARNRNSNNSDNINNSISLGVKADGTLAVSVSTPAGWRSAIGAVNKAGDTMTGNLIISKTGDTYVEAKNTETGCRIEIDVNAAGKHGLWSSGYYANSTYTASSKWIYYRGTDGEAHSDVKIYGAVWNDYAEMRNVPEAQKENPNLKPGMCVHEIGDGTMAISTNRLERGCKIISDTFGFNIGETEECKTPIAVSGRVLVYINEGREIASSHIGWPVCSGPNGTVSIMTEEEEEKYPSRIIGTISEIPNYEEWGEDKVQVNGRIWIYVK